MRMCCPWGRGPFPGSDYASDLVLDFTASRSVRNKSLLFINHLVEGIFVTAAKRTKLDKPIIVRSQALSGFGRNSGIVA